MGWFQYYRLLEQYSGDLSKASKEEMNWAARGNPNDPHSARALAEKKWREEQESKQSKISCNPVLSADADLGDAAAGLLTDEPYRKQVINFNLNF